MKYNFKDIDNAEMYESARVLIVTGNYSVFNNMALDNIKNQNKSKISTKVIDKGLLDKWGYSYDDIEMTNRVDFNNFLEYVNVPNINGKWICSVDYNFMTKKQKDILNEYIKDPSMNGVLVVTMTEYRDYRYFLNNKLIENSNYSHLIQLSFPTRDILIEIVSKLFNDREVEVEHRAAELFVMKMSRAYDEYEVTIDGICLNKQGSLIDYNAMTKELSGINNYILDDFIAELLKEGKYEKVNAGKQIYKMVNSLVEDMTAQELVTKLKYKIDDYIEIRTVINKGYIPTFVRYSIEEIKGRIEKELGESHRILKMSDYTFRKKVFIASRTSLEDWICMRMIISNIDSLSGNSFSSRISNEETAKKVLFSLIHRTSYNKTRLYNDIGFDNILEKGMYDINSILYDDEMLNKQRDVDINNNNDSNKDGVL